MFRIALRDHPSGRRITHRVLVRVQIRLEVRQMHVVVAVRQKGVPQRLEDARLITAEMVGKNQVQRGARFRLVVIVPLRVVPASAIRHLLGRQTEQKEIFLARFLRHLDGRSVARADGQRPVHHELHVARAAGFVAGG